MAELPQNWIEIKLKHLIKFVIGGDWGTEKPSISNSERVAVIRGTDYKYWNKIRAKEAAIRYVKKSSLEKRQLNIGDIVLEISGGGPTQPVARTIVIDKYAIESNKCSLICSNFFRKISLKPSINPAYLNFYCQYAHKIGLFNDFQTQTTNLRNLNFNDFINNVFIPIPPENEQFKIINKLDKIISKIDDVNTRLNKIPTALKRARQSILNQAITGELTKDWREKNSVKEIWKNCIFNDIAIKLTDGSHNPPPKKNSGYVVISAKNIKNNNIVFNDNDRYTDKIGYEKENKRTQIKKGDIILGIIGASIGNIAMYNSDKKVIAQRSVAIINTSINNEYVYFYMRSSVYQNMLIDRTKGAAQGGVYLNDLRDIPIVVPPLEEQAEIVRRVKLAFEKLDKIELRYQKAKEYSDKLTQSILNKAFRGELVPQDPNDKPISLDDIQVQIAEKPSKKRKTLKNNKVQEMTKEIIEILKEYPEGISPEELFKNSKYSQKDFTDHDIIEFYKELSNLLDSKLTEEKDSVNHKILIKKVK